MAETFYDILGVPRTASEKDVRAAYRKLARKFHPDVNPGDASAEARFRKINEAYEVLSDAGTRKDYDEFGPDWKHAAEFRKAGVGPGSSARAPWGGPGRGESVRFFSRGGQRPGDMGDIFRMFGFGAGNGAPQGDEPQEIEVEVSLDEAFRGATRLVSVTRPDGGESRLEVKVPAGIGDGGRVRIKPPGGPEFQLLVRIRADARFRREGADLHSDVPVPLVDAVLGGEVEVPTMSGKVALKVPPGTQNGRTFRLTGKGMPRMGSAPAYGDLYATMKVVLPDDLSDDERQMFERMRESRRAAGAGRGRGGKR